MHNSGVQPLTLVGVKVGGSGGCEEYGFSVSDCSSHVTIMPNRTRTIEIT